MQAQPAIFIYSIDVSTYAHQQAAACQVRLVT
jgi:hypothetical protein